jgi:hypothetical protein
VPLVAAVAALLLAAVFYFHARFQAAAATGLVYAGLMAHLLREEFGHTPGMLAAVFLLLVPALCVVVHAIDARRGLFLLPTVYGIGIAFIGALAALLAVGAAKLLG